MVIAKKLLKPFIFVIIFVKNVMTIYWLFILTKKEFLTEIISIIVALTIIEIILLTLRSKKAS